MNILSIICARLKKLNSFTKKMFLNLLWGNYFKLAMGIMLRNLKNEWIFVLGLESTCKNENILLLILITLVFAH